MNKNRTNLLQNHLAFDFRLLHEHPPPINLTVLEEKEESPTSSKRGSLGDFFDLVMNILFLIFPTKTLNKVLHFRAARTSPTSHQPKSLIRALKKSCFQPNYQGNSCLKAAFESLLFTKYKLSSLHLRASSGLSGLLSSMSSSSFQCKPLAPGKCEGLSFNGLGGHGKSEEFPKPFKKDFNVKRLPSLKPKGVSRPSSLR
jgi:hypothetical protein